MQATKLRYMLPALLCPSGRRLSLRQKSKHLREDDIFAWPLWVGGVYWTLQTCALSGDTLPCSSAWTYYFLSTKTRTPPLPSLLRDFLLTYHMVKSWRSVVPDFLAVAIRRLKPHISISPIIFQGLYTQTSRLLAGIKFSTAFHRTLLVWQRANKVWIHVVFLPSSVQVGRSAVHAGDTVASPFHEPAR